MRVLTPKLSIITGLAILLARGSMAENAGPAEPLDFSRENLEQLCREKRDDDTAREMLLRAIESGVATKDDGLCRLVTDRLRSILRPADRDGLVKRIGRQLAKPALEFNPDRLAALLCSFGPLAAKADLPLLKRCLEVENEAVRASALRVMVDLGTDESLGTVSAQTAKLDFRLAGELAKSYYAPAVAHLLATYSTNAMSFKPTPQQVAENRAIAVFFAQADERAIDGLVMELSRTTRAAAWDLGERVLKKLLNPDNAESLLPFLDHKSEAALLRGLELFLSVADEKARTKLAARVVEEMTKDNEFRSRGIAILGRARQGSDVIGKVLTDTDRFILISACRAAADLGNPALGARILPLLAHDHFDVRLEACDALGILKIASAAPRLEAIFKEDSDFFVKDAAARALTKITGQSVRLLDHPDVQARVKANAQVPERRTPRPGCPILGLIPEPQEVTLRDGSFPVDSEQCAIVIDKGASESDRFSAEALAADLKRFYGVRLRVVDTDGAQGKCGIFIASVRGDETTRALARRLGMKWDRRLGDQGYLLTITADVVAILAEADTGRYYGTVTLLQLIKRTKDGKHLLPTMDIVDWPDLKFRGFLGDYRIPGLSEEDSLRLLSRFKFNFCRGGGGAVARKYHVFDLPEAPCGGHCGPPILGLPESMWEAFGGREPGPCPVAFGMHEGMGTAIRRKIGHSPCPYWFARADETGCGTDPRSRRFVGPDSPAFRGEDGRGWLWSYHWAKNVIEPTRDLGKTVVLWSDTVSKSQDLFVQFIDKKDVYLVPWAYGGDGSGRTRRWQECGMMDRVIGMPALATGGGGAMHPANLGNGFAFTENLCTNGAAGVWQSLWADYAVGSLVVPWIATAHLGWSFERNPGTQQEFGRSFLPNASAKIFGDRRVLPMVSEMMELRARVPDLSDKKGQGQFVGELAERFAGSAKKSPLAHDRALFERGFSDLLSIRRKLAAITGKLREGQTWAGALTDFYCCEAERRMLGADLWIVFAEALVEFDGILASYRSEHKRSILEPPAQGLQDEGGELDDELDEALHEADAAEKALIGIRDRFSRYLKRYRAAEKWAQRHRYPKPRQGGTPAQFLEAVVEEMSSAVEAYRTQGFIPENLLSRCRGLGHQLPR